MRNAHATDAATPAAAEPPSKSQLKRDMHAVQKLGESLVALDATRLEKLALPETLHAAIVQARKITAHEGRRRQMQYIGKLMRQVDPESIRRQLDDLTGDSRAAVALMHRCERLRDALLADDDALTAFAAEHPGADLQVLRSTIRAARREAEHAQPPKHARALYRWLHEFLSTPAAP